MESNSMAAEPQKKMNISKLDFNNFIVHLRKFIKKAVQNTISKLIRSAKMLKEKQSKKSEEITSKNVRRAEHLFQEISVIRTLNDYDIAKFAVLCTKPLDEVLSDPKSSMEERALVRLAHFKCVKELVHRFRAEHPTWAEDVRYHVKTLGLNYRKKRLKRLKDAGKLDTFLTQERRNLILLNKLGGLGVDPKLLQKLPTRDSYEKRVKTLKQQNKLIMKRGREDANESTNTMRGESGTQNSLKSDNKLIADKSQESFEDLKNDYELSTTKITSVFENVYESSENESDDERVTKSNHSDGEKSNHSDGEKSNHSDGEKSNHSDGEKSNHSDGEKSNHSDGEVWEESNLGEFRTPLVYRKVKNYQSFKNRATDTKLQSRNNNNLQKHLKHSDAGTSSPFKQVQINTNSGPKAVQGTSEIRRINLSNIGKIEFCPDKIELDQENDEIDEIFGKNATLKNQQIIRREQNVQRNKDREEEFYGDGSDSTSKYFKKNAFRSEANVSLHARGVGSGSFRGRGRRGTGHKYDLGSGSFRGRGRRGTGHKYDLGSDSFRGRGRRGTGHKYDLGSDSFRGRGRRGTGHKYDQESYRDGDYIGMRHGDDGEMKHGDDGEMKHGDDGEMKHGDDGEMKQRGRGCWGRESRRRGFKGRGGDYRGKGNEYKGRGNGYGKVESFGNESQQWKGRDDETKGNNTTTKGRATWKPSGAKKSNSFNSDSNLHPSWVAKQKQLAAASMMKFEGKKIIFD